MICVLRQGLPKCNSSDKLSMKKFANWIQEKLSSLKYQKALTLWQKDKNISNI